MTDRPIATYAQTHMASRRPRPDDAAFTNLRHQAWRQVDAAVTIADTGGVIVDWNDGATRLFGWTADEAIGSTWSDLTGPVAADPDPRRAQVREHLDEGRGYTGELTVAIKAGQAIRDQRPGEHRQPDAGRVPSALTSSRSRGDRAVVRPGFMGVGDSSLYSAGFVHRARSAPPRTTAPRWP